MASEPSMKTAVSSIAPVTHSRDAHQPATRTSPSSPSSSSSSSAAAGDALVTPGGGGDGNTAEDPTAPRSPPRWYSYCLTREFWIVLAVGQICALCTTSSSTFSTYIAKGGTDMPAFQSLFVYALITLIYTPILVF